MSDYGQPRVEGGTVRVVPACFEAGIELARSDRMTGLMIDDDLNDAVDAPSCDLSLLEKVPCLERFAVSSDVRARRLLHFETLYALTGLRFLALHDYRSLDLSRLPLLQELFVRDRPGLRGLGELRHLRELHVWGLRDGDLSGLHALTSLSRLRIIQASTKVTALAGLEVLTGLQKLELSHCRAVRSVGGLPTDLRVLHVWSCGHLTDGGFLAGHELLDFVSMTTIASLDFVPTMRALTRLSFESVLDGDLSPVLASSTLRSIFCTDKKHHSHTQEALQAMLDGSVPRELAGPARTKAPPLRGADAVVERWRESLEEGDTRFTLEGIEAVASTLVRFERGALSARRSQEVLRKLLRETVLELDRLGGSEGVHGCFLETDEREELVPYLLDVVVRCGLDLGDDTDPTDAYRRW